MKPPAKQRPKRTGIFIYCDSARKTRIRHCAVDAEVTLFDYILAATMQQVEADETKLGRKRNRSKPR